MPTGFRSLLDGDVEVAVVASLRRRHAALQECAEAIQGGRVGHVEDALVLTQA